MHISLSLGRFTSSNLDVKLLTLVQCRLGAVRKRRYQRDDYIQSEPLRLSMLSKARSDCGKRNHDELAEEIHQNRQRHVKFRISVRFTWALGATIWNGLWLAFHDEAPPLAAVCNWFNEFKRGRTNLTDDLREGRPSTATTENDISAVRLMALTKD
ncbi:Putative uncharacterized protein FLJ37770 [Eumeta japonica]|uniref:Mos1 transposase HTH domain-containing protein n=1 Tax=Eumeta variegata TaxID=151549 RepID=A0A4C1UTA3_EUMVA|nr:Putative uncharacterized protein FLJ37770 [Eumeta japonica]